VERLAVAVVAELLSLGCQDTLEKLAWIHEVAAGSQIINERDDLVGLGPGSIPGW
jgi:hypothetical protein